MATTDSGFARVTLGGVVSLLAASRTAIGQIVSALAGTRIDKLTVDLSLAGFAKNGAGRYALSGTTVKTIDLTNLTTGAQSYAGDTAFTKFRQLILYNDGATSVTVAVGGSNPATLGMTGALTVPAGISHVLNYVSAGITVDATHKNIDITPASGGSFVLSVGGL